MIVTRIPPSPTGNLHIGTSRTALFNYLFAKANGGHFVFRSEDTDKSRSTKEFEVGIIEGLSWLGLMPDNQNDIVRQSERGDIYRNYLEKIIASGAAYISKEKSIINPAEMIEVVRLKNLNKEITFTDIIRGEITFNTTELGDIVIARNLDDALYHFTVVVDDHLMGVSHVIRGEDHIPNTPRQILIQEALGINRPIYAHLPLILAPDRSKMSKRHGAVDIKAYRDMGYTKEAVINYLALLGWNPGTNQELFTLDELIPEFSLEKIQKGGAIFDIKKFNWFNREHLRKYSEAEFWNYLDFERETSLPEYFAPNSEALRRASSVFKERIDYREQIMVEIRAGEYEYIFQPSNYETELLKWKNDESVINVKPRLEKAIEIFKESDFLTVETVKAALWPYAEEVGKGELLWPLRIALSGKAQSTDPFTLAFILGKEETLSRIKIACDKLIKQ